MISFISSFEIINAVIPDSRTFLCTSDPAVVVNPNGTKTLLANGLCAFFIKVKQVFSNGSRNLPKNLPLYYFRHLSF